VGGVLTTSGVGPERNDRPTPASGPGNTESGALADGVTGTVPVLQMHNLVKSFGGVRALRGVDLTVMSGEIHGLVGQNGCGKSTLIKVLAGFHAPDHGARLEFNGIATALPLAPGAFRDLGMRFVHQDLGLILSLSVLENLLIEELSTGTDWSVSWRAARREAVELFARSGIDLDPDSRVGDLRPVQRALLAIVRAVSSMPVSGDGTSRGLLVLDEPTVFLPRGDTELLFDLTRRVAATGAGVLFVSHDLDEVAALTDRATVLRDGEVVGTVATAETSHDALVEMIVGHRLERSDVVRDDRLSTAEIRAQVTGLSGGLVSGADVSVRRGEVLGVTGLTGSGFEELPYLLFGVRAASSGHLTLEGHELDLTGLAPAQAFAAGIALVPADRQRDGAILSLSVLDNVSMQMLGDYRRGPFLRRKRLTKDSRVALRRFDVRPADPSLTCSSLSGGNQQKVLMAKWLQARPSLLIVHEPTQGVDVGAREEIFAVIREAAQTGMSVLCASSDYEQLALLCDRVLVFRQGRVGAELTGAELTKEHISEQCYSAPAESGRKAS